MSELFLIRLTFVGNERYVFNIGGNQVSTDSAPYLFPARTVYIKFIGTHREYDRIDAATIDYKK